MRARPEPFAYLAATILIVSAALLYSPILGIGLLADDFALYDWALNGEILPRSWPYVRPLLLATWVPIVRLGDLQQTAVMLHLLNVVVHGVNAVLTMTLARRGGLSRLQATVAGALFVCYPTSVEAVAWPSAFSDVLLTTFVLAAILVATAGWPNRVVLPLIAGLVVLSLATKETAIGIGGLLLLVSLFGRVTAGIRQLLLSGCVAIGLAIGYLALRLYSGRASGHPGVNIAALSALLTQPFIALLLPFHHGILHLSALVGAWCAAGGAAVILATRHLRERRVAVAAAVGLLWILASVLPTIGLFVIGHDLQGTRYLYLGTAIWTIMIGAALAPATADAQRGRLRLVACAVLVAAGAVATWHHQQYWRAAASLRGTVLSIIADLPPECRRVQILAPPDNLDGAYVARNGLTEAVRLVHGRSIEIVHDRSEVPDRCRLDLAAFTPSR